MLVSLRRHDFLVRLAFLLIRGRWRRWPRWILHTQSPRAANRIHLVYDVFMRTCTGCVPDFHFFLRKTHLWWFNRGIVRRLELVNFANWNVPFLRGWLCVDYVWLVIGYYVFFVWENFLEGNKWRYFPSFYKIIRLFLCDLLREFTKCWVICLIFFSKLMQELKN